MSIWGLFAKGFRAETPMRIRRKEVNQRERRAAQTSFFSDPTYHATRRLDLGRE